MTHFLLHIIGPVTLVDSSTKKAKLIGVVSWGVGCALLESQDPVYGYPGVYSEVANVMDWVNFNTNYCGSPTPAENDYMYYGVDY